MRQQTERLVLDYVNPAVQRVGERRQGLGIEFLLDRRGAGNDQRVALFGVGRGGPAHTRQVVFDFLLTAAGEQGNHRAFRRQVEAVAEFIMCLSVVFPVVCDFVDSGVANIVDRVVVFTFEEVYLKRQDGEERVNVAPDVLYTVFFPSPYLRRNVVEYGNAHVLTDKTGNLQVEPRVVNQNDDVGVQALDGLFARAEVVHDGREVEQDGDEAHVGHRLVVLHADAAGLAHQVASVKIKLSVGVALAEGFHEVGSVEVAAGFAYD